MEKQKEDQIKTVKKIYDCSNTELDILTTELKVFVDKYSKEPEICAKKKLNKMNFTSMFKILKETKEHFKEIGIWKNKYVYLVIKYSNYKTV